LRGPIAGFVFGLFAVMVALMIIYVADIGARVLDVTNEAVGEALNTSPVTEYSASADAAVAFAAVVVVALAIFVVVAYSAHLRRR